MARPIQTAIQRQYWWKDLIYACQKSTRLAAVVYRAGVNGPIAGVSKEMADLVSSWKGRCYEIRTNLFDRKTGPSTSATEQTQSTTNIIPINNKECNCASAVKLGVNCGIGTMG